MCVGTGLDALVLPTDPWCHELPVTEWLTSSHKMPQALRTSRSMTSALLFTLMSPTSHVEPCLRGRHERPRSNPRTRLQLGAGARRMPFFGGGTRKLGALSHLDSPSRLDVESGVSSCIITGSGRSPAWCGAENPINPLPNHSATKATLLHGTGTRKSAVRIIVLGYKWPPGSCANKKPGAGCRILSASPPRLSINSAHPLI